MYNKKVAYYSIFCCNLHEKKHEILTAQHHKPLYNINRSEKEGKNIQTAGYNGARTILDFDLDQEYSIIPFCLKDFLINGRLHNKTFVYIFCIESIHNMQNM